MSAVLERATLPRPASDRLRWQRAYKTTLVVVDLVSAVAATCIAKLADIGTHGAYLDGVVFHWFVIAFPVCWLAILGAVGAYQQRYLGVGADEYKRVADATLRLTALGAVVVFLAKIQIARGFVIVLLPMLWLLTIAGRRSARRWVHWKRRRGEFLRRVVIIGPIAAARHLVARLERETYAGYKVVSVFPWATIDFSDVGSVIRKLADCDADTVAVVEVPGEHGELRSLAWQLEGTGVELVVAPLLADIAGPRIHVRPVAGLPLLHVEEPCFGGAARTLKRAIDVFGSAVLLVLLAPLLLAIGITIRLSDPGPALFMQQRVGRSGRPFRMYKFRTMLDGADQQFAHLIAATGSGHGMFVKDPFDPRVTPIGRVLRRLSLDELPQLFNVLLGDMSFVGPRPLPLAVSQTALDAQRRLLVRPGITGLWQVSGRSDLPWEEALRMDLYYVENWSLSLDLLIAWRTFSAVWKAKGAY